MIRKSFVWGSYKNKKFRSEYWFDRLWLLALSVAGGLLYSVNLGGLPLRDWDEGIVAQVAREIWRAPVGSLTWLYPTLDGVPYLNKPPLMHWLIAGAYAIGGVNEWTARLPGAGLTVASVLLLYGIGREVFARRTPAVFSALVYLTLLPVVRHGRLAMLDGAVLCFFLLMVWCLLRARRDLRWGLGAGIGFGLMCLTKGILGLLLAAIAISFIVLDTPRLLTSLYLWSGILMGCAPVALWYAAQWLHYSENLLTNLRDQSFSRVWTTVESHGGPPWYYLLEILKYGLPWLLFLPQGFRLVWENRNLGWAKLTLVWVAGYLVIISLMGTKLPWYVLPVYPALALVVGAQLAEVWRSSIFPGTLQAEVEPYPLPWAVILALLALIGWAASLYMARINTPSAPDVAIIIASLALTMTVAAVLAYKQDFQFLPVLIWGSYVSLLLLMLSGHWVWELAEAYPVKPVAQLIRQGTPAGQVVYTSYPYYRPSLNFYSDRRVIPAPPTGLQHEWQQADPYLLVDAVTLKSLNLDQIQIVGVAKDWALIKRRSHTESLPVTYTPVRESASTHDRA